MFELTFGLSINILSSLRFLKVKRINNLLRYSSQTSKYNEQYSIENLFLNTEVQRILKKITGMDYEKIFAVSKKPYPLEAPKYEFVTEKGLKELQEKTALKAAQKLQIPPVMAVREPINEILSKDPELQGHLKAKYVFTDISPTVSPRDRVITVREIDGTLRKATWEERDRMNQVWYPMPGRHLEIPKLFESPYLDNLLEEGSYKFVLDSACIQFEPDDPEYHRVKKATYEHIKSKKQFDELRSTRYFGTMAFYYAYNKDIDLLLVDMIERQLLSDASDTVNLLYLMHQELAISENVDRNNEIAVIEDYIEKYATQKEDLKYALRCYLEPHSNKNEEISL